MTKQHNLEYCPSCGINADGTVTEEDVYGKCTCVECGAYFKIEFSEPREDEYCPFCGEKGTRQVYDDTHDQCWECKKIYQITSKEANADAVRESD